MAKPVVIIGAGQAGAEAALALRQAKYAGPVLLLGRETALPYSRPPLSKDFLLGTLPEERLWLRSAAAYQKAGIDLRTGISAVELDPEARRLTLSTGETLEWSACVLATGAVPRRLSVPGADLANILVLRDMADARQLGALLRPGVRLVVAGAGYLGLELAASARKLGADVVVIEAAARLLARSTSALTAEALAARHRAEGVEIRTGRTVEAFAGAGTVEAVMLDDGSRVPADVVVVSVGAAPDIALARGAGIACATGILADAHGHTSAAGVYAIGDCAEWDVGDGRGPLRLESVQVASQGARAVAATLTGTPLPGLKLPYFWSQQYDLKLQIAGLVPAGIATGDRLEGDPAGAFSVTRSAGGKVLAVETVNDPMKYVAAQKLIGQPDLQSA